MAIDPSWPAYLGRFHPVAVHFPIALLIAAAVADALSLKPEYARVELAARFCLVFGAAGAAIAAPLGWMTAATATVPYEPAWLLTAHRWSGIAAAGLAVLSAIAAQRRSRSDSRSLVWLYRSALYASALTVAIAGHFGGLLVYGENYFSRGGGP